MRRLHRQIIIVLCCWLGVASGALKADVESSSSQPIHIVASIPPLAGLIYPMLGEQDSVTVILDAGSSPHGFQFRPSHMRAVQQADLILMVGTPVDAWIQRTAERADSASLQLFDPEKSDWLPRRDSGTWSRDHHHRHGQGMHGHAQQTGLQAVARIDGHIWLDIERATDWVADMSLALQQLRPERAAEFQAREQQTVASLMAARQVWSDQLQAYQTKPFVVMHDAYQYFELRFGLNAAGAVYMNPEVAPSVRRIQEIRDTLVAQGVVCVYQEPQFPTDRLRSVLRGMDVGLGQLDPLGAEGTIVPYEHFYDSLVQSFIACMQDASKP
ncbi:zinc ABC transporter substrate-binding protein [Thiomicrospira sp. ALE5]|uniref:zinc ABC transporter substrate-binding protein n=1 Tax=Thiomicrospira sp. ALE5 TaxID=748650 RepID=UPI0008E15E07|nr:zinc ABC transporter substrate-binding protein [Thiomicrospira sp. ALE5]SFR62856.1 zinc transport system substrate-binding protein [Thiomicrospira sp. ALE5]